MNGKKISRLLYLISCRNCMGKEFYRTKQQRISFASSPQPSKFTSAVGICQGFCRGKQCFYSNHLGNKNIAELIISQQNSKIYIQFTIFNTYFSTKLSFTNKRYHLHVLSKCLYVLQEVRSVIYVRQFIHPLSRNSHGSGTNFAFTSYIIVSVKFCNVTI